MGSVCSPTLTVNVVSDIVVVGTFNVFGYDVVWTDIRIEDV